jgi:hypothetical protein
MSVPSEISAAVVLIQYWNSEVNPAVRVTILILLSVAVAVLFVGVYGELEFFFAILKILIVVGVMILGLVIDLDGVPGQPRLGFHYWKTPGPFVAYIADGAWGRFLGFWAVMSNAVYSFPGVESLAMAAVPRLHLLVCLDRMHHHPCDGRFHSVHGRKLGSGLIRVFVSVSVIDGCVSLTGDLKILIGSPNRYSTGRGGVRWLQIDSPDQGDFTEGSGGAPST